MPTYIAFLRAINLGATRKFPKDAVKKATEAAGGTDVETYLNTGNVRLTSARRSVAAVARDLEQAYAADRGFEVPTVVFTPAEVVEIVARATALADQYGPVKNHYIALYADAPSAAAATAVHALEVEVEGERCVVDGRAAHALLHGDIHSAKLFRAKQFNALGVGTSRTRAVLTTVAEKWCADVE